MILPLSKCMYYIMLYFYNKFMMDISMIKMEKNTYMCVCVCVCVGGCGYMHLPTLPCNHDVTQGQFFKRGLTGFPRTRLKSTV